MNFYESLQQLNDIIDINYNDRWVFLEGEGLTYYELRRFLTILYKQISDKDTQKVLANVLKALATMEIKKLPVPTIQKLKSTSPKIFG